jgi:AcrR family transcriptional regulator
MAVRYSPLQYRTKIRLTGAATNEQEKRRRRLTPAARRALIDEAATRVFAERGYEAATMQDIAHSAGVVASVLYDHYRSKRELYVALLEQHGEALMKRTIRAPSSTDGRIELHGQIDDFFAEVEAEPFVWRMLLRDPFGDAEIAATHGRVQAKATAEIAAVLAAREGDERGGPADPTTIMVAEMVKSSLNGLVSWWWDHPEVSREEVVNTATAVIWDGLRTISSLNLDQ